MRIKWGVAALMIGTACGGAETNASSASSNGTPGSTRVAHAAVAPEVPEETESTASPPPSEPNESTDSARPRFDVSEREALRLCELEASEDDVTFDRCAFGVGQDLPNGARVDLLEFEYVDGVTVTIAKLVIRSAEGSAEDLEYPTTFTLAEGQQEPGMDIVFTIGTMTVDGTQITVPVEVVATTYPNTGDPDLPTGAIEEHEAYVVQCDASDGFYECERLAR